MDLAGLPHTAADGRRAYTTPSPSPTSRWPAYERALQPKKLVTIDGGHFDPYTGQFDKASRRGPRLVHRTPTSPRNHLNGKERS